MNAPEVIAERLSLLMLWMVFALAALSWLAIFRSIVVGVRGDFRLPRSLFEATIVVIVGAALWVLVG